MIAKKLSENNKNLLNWNILKNTFNSLRAYRINTISKIVYFILNFTIQIYLWKAINISNSNIPINLDEMLIYIFLSCSITVFINFESSVIPKIGQNIISGNISMYLIKPIQIKKQLLYEYIGTLSFRLIFNLIPLVIIGVFAFNIHLKIQFDIFILLILSVVNAFYLYFIISYTVGLLSFWYTSIGNMNVLVDSMISLFSGSIIPFYLLSPTIYNIFKLLPFHLIYFSPISIVIESLDIKSSFFIILNQLIWILAFEVLSSFLYKKGIKKLNIQGG